MLKLVRSRSGVNKGTADNKFLSGVKTDFFGRTGSRIGSETCLQPTEDQSSGTANRFLGEFFKGKQGQTQIPIPSHLPQTY